MDIRRLTDSYTVSPQILPEHVPEIAQAGFTTVICNRPDDEIPMEIHAHVMQIAVEAAGMTFINHPLTHDTMTPANIAIQMQIVADAPGPVFAYCASGTRCSVIWCLGQPADVDTDTVIKTAAEAGYDLSALRPTLDAQR